MTDVRQFTSAESATSAACAEYFLRSALHATRFLWRHEQVMGAVARRQITTAQVEHALADATERSAVVQEVATAISAFTTSLMQRSLLPRMPSTAKDDEAATEAAAVLEQHDADASKMVEQLAALAGPTVTTGARRRALTRLTLSDANQQLAETARAWFTLLDALSGASVRAMNPALLDVLRTAQPIGYDREVIELAAPLATHASAHLMVENTLARSASLSCTCRDIRRADGIGPAFTPAMTVSPAHQRLDAGTVGDVELTLWLDDAQFDPHATYVGALSVVSDGGTTVDIPLRITTAPAHS